ncbi:MAG: hypothetical protein MJZ34_04185 [Paludibacteraceae bacterium]|nr:hypothetical protein [Paludibacteraceae bacterium]
MKNLIVIFVLLNLFLTENILLLVRFSNFSLVNNMLLAFSILLFFVSNIVIYRVDTKYCVSFSLLVLLQVGFYLVTGSDNFKSTMSIGALFVAGAFPVNELKNKNIWKFFFFSFLCFYVIECSLAVIERVVSVNLPILRVTESLWEGISSGEDSSFRSEALLGHPLQNALIVLTAMSFILMSKMSVLWKYGLWFLGFLSLLCFNTRFAIVFSVLLFGIYILNSSKWGYSKREKLQTRLFIVIGCITGMVLFFVIGLGDRLLNMGLMDESSSYARLDLFDLFIGVDFSSLLFPMDSKLISSLMAYRDVKVIENFWIVYLLNYGLVFLGIIIFFYFVILKNLYRNYTVFQTLFTVMTFFLTASTNNSLVTSWHIMVYYLFFVVLFNPSMQMYILPSYLKSDDLINKRKILYLFLRNLNKEKI